MSYVHVQFQHFPPLVTATCFRFQFSLVRRILFEFYPGNNSAAVLVVKS